MKIESIPYNVYVNEGEALFESYSEACDWLDEMGFQFKKTRFGEYKKDIEDFGGKIAKDESQEVLESSFHRFLNAHAEAIEIIRIKKTMERSEFDTFKNQLKKVVTGSAFRNYSEKDQSRNFSFELSMAARFITAGFEVNLNHIADIVADVGDFKVYIECKRLRSKNNIAANIKKANEQLRSRILNDNSSKVRGLIAVNVNDVLNPDNDMLIVDSPEDLQRLNSEHLNEFVIVNEKILRTNEYKKTLGVFCEYVSQSLVHKIEPVATCNCRGAKLYQYRSEGGDKDLIKILANGLANQNIE